MWHLSISSVVGPGLLEDVLKHKVIIYDDRKIRRFMPSYQLTSSLLVSLSVRLCISQSLTCLSSSSVLVKCRVESERKGTTRGRLREQYTHTMTLCLHQCWLGTQFTFLISMLTNFSLFNSLYRPDFLTLFHFKLLRTRSISPLTLTHQQFCDNNSPTVR